ncbi:Dihydroorotate dehydrogenase (quinone) [hydrothermal vent metagenome]|uniref:dihydroorotate dehydrogenase (quinone) n=1 Tax=hydrothermal vent metagenome TaxID=652676 RepID=A0A3B0W8I0_9ZZZZ
MIEYFGRKFLQKLPAEIAHDLSIQILASPAASLVSSRLIHNPVELFGVTFPNPVGLAAGFDKNADAVTGLAQLGFGFIEVGTVTPKPQVGNPKPRLFRLPANQAIINRMGFNNKGVDYLVARLEKYKPKIIIGINIGKNKTTPNKSATDDYVHCFKKVQHLADYITINISSPNTEDLRQLQETDHLVNLLSNLKELQLDYAKNTNKYTPIVVKIAPDQDDEATITIAKTIKNTKMDGIICTNTTINKNNLKKETYQYETGGISGKPLLSRSNQIIRLVRKTVGAKFPIIGVGGILTDADAMSKMSAGAELIQIYTGLIYQGSQLIANINKKLNKENQIKKTGYESRRKL